MLYLEITTIGEMAFSHSMKLEEGYRFDIPFDETSLPYIPLAGLLRKEGLLPEGTELSFAHPKGYAGMVRNADMLLRNSPGCARFIRACFTNERFLKKEGFRVRTLKAGLTFRAALVLPKHGAEQARAALENISHLGFTAEGITGETVFRTVEDEPAMAGGAELRTLCDYTALEYSATLFAPACFHVPYGDGLTTRLYVPGAVMMQYLQGHMEQKDDTDWESLRFSNAYMARKGERLVPVPMSMAVIKQDKHSLRYRFASERDPRLVEQVTGLDGAFTADLDTSLVRHTTPATEHISDGEGGLLDALSAGQSFRGMIYGKDGDLRRLAQWMGENPVFHVGKLSDTGFGEMYCKVERLLEREVPLEAPSRMFDVLCVSDVLLLNSRGMNVFSAEDLVEELEHRLGAPGRLRIVNRYTGVHRDFSENPRWGRDNPTVRFLAKGSTVRVGTADGGYIDISPIRHCFVGERNAEGYGEICVFQAGEQYYRHAANLPPERYQVDYPISMQLAQIGARFTQKVILDMLHSRIRGLGAADREEHQRGISADELMPADLLAFLKENYDPELSDETVRAWYREGLEENSDEWDFHW